MLYYMLFGVLEEHLKKWMIEFKMQTKNQNEMEHLKAKKRIEVKNSLGGINRWGIIGEISKLQDKAKESSQKVTGR